MARTVALALILAAACGDNLRPVILSTDASFDDAAFVAALAALPGVHDVVEKSTQTPGFHYFVLHFTQPVDHSDSGGATFLQEVSLLHRDVTAPMIVHTSGYSDYYLDNEVELTALVHGNQVSIEHRYFGTSRPTPADWTKLTIEQMADDEHAIVTALRTIYPGKYLATGGSKGGMTAVFYRRFFPDDVDGTVPYVAPLSFAAPDERYPPFLDMVGTTTCRQAVRDAATEMLMNRRAALETATAAEATQKGYAYTRVLLGPAVESAIDSLEWSFWQYYGVTQCSGVPATTATDAAMFTFLDTISPPSDSDDEQTGFFDAYYYQAYFQLGYPDGGAAYLTPYLMYTDADYAGSFPTAQPVYDGGIAMHDIDTFVEQSGSRLLFVYGQWDPWTAGAFTLGAATDSLLLVQPQGTHNSEITELAASDTTAALTKLAAWTGVTPVMTSERIAEPKPPHVPSAVMRAFRALRARRK